MVIQENKFVKKIPGIKNFESIEIPSIAANSDGVVVNTETFRKDFKELIFTCTGSFSIGPGRDDSEVADGRIYIYDGTNAIRLFYSKATGYDYLTYSTVSYGYSIKLINNNDGTYNISIIGNSGYGFVNDYEGTVTARHDILNSTIFNESEDYYGYGGSYSYHNSVNSSIDLSTFSDDIQLRIVNINDFDIYPLASQKITGIYIIK